MACLGEYIGYCGSAVVAGAALAAIVIEVGSVAGAPLTVPTAVAGIAAALALISSGMAYSNCLENAGKADEAQRMREEMDQIQREIDRLQELVGAN